MHCGSSQRGHARQSVVRTGNLKIRPSVRCSTAVVGLTAEAGGRASRLNHALTGVVKFFAFAAAP